MPEDINTFSIKDFSAGWCPSDDENNGRMNALLKMTGLDLRENGALNMAPAYAAVSTALVSEINSIYCKILGTSKFLLTTNAAGTVYNFSTPVISLGIGSDATPCFNTAFGYIFLFYGAAYVKINNVGATNIVLSAEVLSPLITAVPGTQYIAGDYEWIQVDVELNGAYINKSPASPILSASVPSGYSVTITGYNPTLTNPNATNAWIFRRKISRSEIWYRVADFPVSGGVFTFTDTTTDLEADVIDEQFNVFLSQISDYKYLANIGPIAQRLVYFSADSVIFSEINTPGLYDPRQVIKYCDSEAEKFLWARLVGENTIVIATTNNFYTLSGTFTVLPDGFIDVYLRPLKVLPLAANKSACVYNNLITYFATDGWRAMSVSGESRLLTSPNVDALYGDYDTRYGYNSVAKNLVSGLTDCCAFQGNKLWSSLPNQLDGSETRIEFYDFTRTYWAPYLEGKNFTYITACNDDGTLYGFNKADLTLYQLNVNNSFLHSFNMLTKRFLITSTNQRHDVDGVSIVANTGGQDVIVQLYLDDHVLADIGTVINTPSMQKVFLTFGGVQTVKKIQFSIFSDACYLFNLSEIIFSYSSRPVQTNFVRIWTNFGTEGYKKIDIIPYRMNTLNNDVTMSVYFDNVLYLSYIFNSTYAKTHVFYLLSHVNFVDMEIQLSSNGLFEPYGLELTKTVDPNPEHVRWHLVEPSNFGIAALKRLRVWPFVLDCMGGTVLCNLTVDGAYPASTSFTGTGKQTYYFYITSDIIGTDFGCYFSSSTASFEIWEIGKPEIVEIFPVGKKFDQLGSAELFRYTKINMLQLLIYSQNDFDLTVTVYFSDTSQWVTSISIVANKEDVYEINLPKTIAGSVIRIELGPADYPFYRIYGRARVAAQGKDTEMQWVNLVSQTEGGSNG